MASVSAEPVNRLSIPETMGAGMKQSRVLPLIVVLFLASLLVPFLIHAGPLRLSVYRILLILTFVPVVISWVTGHAGRLRVADLAYLMYCVWAMVSFTYNHGTAGIQAGGIVFFETLGPYLIARVSIRSVEAFEQMVKVFFRIVVILLPFAFIEAVFERNLILDFAERVMDVPSRVVKEPRLGMQRVQGPFEHPILFGVFCGAGVALTWLVMGFGKFFWYKSTRTGTVLLTGFFSLSAGPMAGMATQVGLLIWNRILRGFRGRWKLLFVLFITMWVGLELVANRPAAQIIFQNFSFHSGNALMRLHIWNFGTENILNNPVFGLGFNDWERPDWMLPSVDMYWIIGGMRHGMPGLFFTFLGFFAVFLPLAFRKGLDPRRKACQLALCACLVAFFVTGWTVHYWNATYVLLHFLLGSGLWMLDKQPDPAAVSAPKSEPETGQKRSRYARSGADAQMPTTRFEPKKRRS